MVITLDLSYNYLGKNGSAYLPLPEGDSDWGSSATSNNPFVSLQNLDLSENFFQGAQSTHCADPVLPR
jgi:hypothetical protein